MEARQRIRLPGELGDALAQTNLGFRYNKGRGTPQDDAEAAE